MGNKLCKKKSDVVDNSQHVNNNNRSPSRFDRIINRLHLKPATWKSESHLSKKEGNRSKSEEAQHGESIFYTKPLSKSSDWTDVELEVPVKDDEHIHLRNPQLSLIFDNDKGTPTPPPRKQHKGNNFRQKFEKMAKNTIQALQGDRMNQNDKIPIEEPLMVKRKIDYSCPLCDSDEKNHNRDHHHHHNGKIDINSTNIKKDDSQKKSKSNKRMKNLSVVSLPNYNDLKLSLVESDPLNSKSTSKKDLNSSSLSLQNPSTQKITFSQSTGKLDTYITRCRSFGSILPQQLKRIMPQKPKPVDITSDDSFGPLEDWDLGLIEHYNPKDTSLPRPRKILPPKTNKDVLSGIENLIVKEEDIVPQKPKPPARRTESLVKKINKESSKDAHIMNKSPEEVCLTPPPSPIADNKEEIKLSNEMTVVSKDAPIVQSVVNTNRTENYIAKKISSVVSNIENKSNSSNDTVQNLKDSDNEPAEHSSLMRILQEFSIKDKQQEKVSNVGNESNFSSLTPSLIEFEKNLSNSLVEDFINAEKVHTRALYS